MLQTKIANFDVRIQFWLNRRPSRKKRMSLKMNGSYTQNFQEALKTVCDELRIDYMPGQKLRTLVTNGSRYNESCEESEMLKVNFELLQNENARLQKELDTVKKQFNDHLVQNQQLQSTVQQLEAELQPLRTQAVMQNRDLQDGFQQQLSQMKQNLSDVGRQSEAESSQLQNALAQLQNESIQLRTANSQFEKESNQIKAMNSELQNETTQLGTANSQLENEFNQLRSTNSELQNA
eukprot:999303_1